MIPRLAVVTAFAAFLAHPAPVRACEGSIQPVGPHLRNTRAMATALADTTPPSAIAFAEGNVTARDPCTCYDDGGVPDCIWYMTLALTVTPGTDDQTPTAQIGYLVTIPTDQEGVSPGNYGDSWGPDSIFLVDNGQIAMTFDLFDTCTDYDFTMTLTPVDLAGNEGPPYPIHVVAPAESHCPTTSADLPAVAEEAGVESAIASEVPTVGEPASDAAAADAKPVDAVPANQEGGNCLAGGSSQAHLDAGILAVLFTLVVVALQRMRRKKAD